MRLVLDVKAPVALDIYDIQGRNVYSEPERILPQGDNMLRWVGETKQGTPAGPGMYLVRVQVGSKTLLAKLFRAASSHEHHH